MYDVAIVGAGVTGCIAGIALAPTHRAIILDKTNVPAERVGECLPPAARRILKRLQLLDRFQGQGHLVCQGIQSYWGSDSLQMVDHLRNPDGFAWHLDRRRFEQFLRQTVRARGVECLWPARLTSVVDQRDRWALEIDGVDTVHAKFVIDAGGRQSPFARKQGIRRQQFDKLIACWTTLPDTTPHRVAVVVATEAGWWYSAPLPNQMRVLAFHSDSDLMENAVKKDLNVFLAWARQNAAIAPFVPPVDPPETDTTIRCPRVTAANSTRLLQVSDGRWAALGDAAISLDPLSSQGMLNGMASAMQLTDLIRAGLQVKARYSYQIERIWRYYQGHKRVVYQQEGRWRSSPFWRRRQ